MTAEQAIKTLKPPFVFGDPKQIEKIRAVEFVEETHALIRTVLEIEGCCAIVCRECGGEGTVKCDKCHGDGECSRCGHECGECDGGGEFECEVCGGKGKFDLWEYGELSALMKLDTLAVKEINLQARALLAGAGARA